MNRHTVLTTVASVFVAAASAQPINDECSGAIGVTEGTYSVSNLDATTRADTTGCLSSDVWFVLTARETGRIRVRACGATFFVYLMVHDGAECTGPNTRCAFTGSECGCGPWTAGLSFPAVAGAAYTIRVGSPLHLAESQGTCELIISRVTADDRELAQYVGFGVIPFSTVGATLDGLELCAELEADIWVRVPNSRAGSTRLTTCSPALTVDTALTVSSCDGSWFICGISATAGCSRVGSTLYVPASRFGANLIQIGALRGQEGGGELSVSLCVGNLDGSGRVDLPDLALFLTNFGSLPEQVGDLDEDGDNDLADLGMLLARFGLPCE